MWLPIALYATPGVYCFITFLTMKPIGGLPEEGEGLRPPPRRWWNVLTLPVAFVVVLVLWPAILWNELRQRDEQI